MRRLGIYTNIPFCKKKCSFCHFITAPLRFPVERYISALIREIKTISPFLKGYKVDTIYFGGGTPSSISVEFLLRIIDAIFENFVVEKDFELTVEVNPEDLSEKFLKKLVNYGVNRISIGIQSFSEYVLSNSGRVVPDFDLLWYLIEKFKNVINFNLDFIIGLSGDSIEIWEENISLLEMSGIKHISLYILELHRGTPLFRSLKKGEISLPEEDEIVNIFEFVSGELEKYGFLRYEISNFAREGFFSRHNLKYWNRENYIGFGSSASSFLSPYAISNSGYVKDYIKMVETNGCDFSIVKKYNLCDEIFEYFMMGMRKVEGVNLKEMKDKFGIDFYGLLFENINFFVEENLLKIDNDRLSFTNRGFWVSNLILSEILSIWEKICVE